MARGTATVDFGATPTDEKTFTITDAAMAGLTYIEPFFMGSDSVAGTFLSGNTADDHKMAAALIPLSADAPIGNNFNVTALVLRGKVTGSFKIRYVGA